MFADGNGKLYDFVARSDETALDMTGIPSKTVQSDAEGADINTIVFRFGITGKMPESIRLPEYADYEDVFDFQSAQNALLQARDDFMALPAHIRKEFDNDPGIFFNVASNPDNIDYLRDLGLAKPKVIPDDVVPLVPKVDD